MIGGVPGEDDRWIAPTGDQGADAPGHEDLPGETASPRPERAGAQTGAATPVSAQSGSNDGNGKAVAALVLGIVGLPICCPLLIPSILALVFGHMAKQEMDRGGNTSSNRGMATAGIILGWIGVGLFVVGVVALILLAALGDGIDLDFDDSDGDDVPNFIDEHPDNPNLNFVAPLLAGVGRGLGLA